MSELISFIYKKSFQINKRCEHFKRKRDKGPKKAIYKEIK